MISLKKLLLEDENLVSVCMVCDKISPLQVGSNYKKSHGLCREHYIAYMTQLRQTDIETVRKTADSKNITTPNTSGAKDTDPLPKMD